MEWLLVFLGGGIGSLLRYGTARILPEIDLSTGDFPYSTLLANLLACLILGAGLALLSRDALTRNQSLLLLTGLCGGFSTFSTFSAELLNLYEAGYPSVAVLYLVASLLSGLAAVAVGLALLR